jgi:signal transduction histidine kinase
MEIFDKKKLIKMEAREKKVTGLLLSISPKIVKEHGGEIREGQMDYFCLFLYN